MIDLLRFVDLVQPVNIFVHRGNRMSKKQSTQSRFASELVLSSANLVNGCIPGFRSASLRYCSPSRQKLSDLFVSFHSTVSFVHSLCMEDTRKRERDNRLLVRGSRKEKSRNSPGRCSRLRILTSRGRRNGVCKPPSVNFMLIQLSLVRFSLLIRSFRHAPASFKPCKCY